MLREILYLFLGPVLFGVLILFSAGLAIRNIAFISHLIHSRTNTSTAEGRPLVYLLKMIGGALLPFHRASCLQPVYTLVRYVFHICLFMVPLFEAGHVVLLQVKFGWHWWPTLPGPVITIMSFLVIGIGFFFIYRRAAFPEIRQDSSMTDFGIILVSIAPFITGYWYANGTMSPLGLSENSMLLLHVLTGETMLVMVVFLFVRTMLVDKKCIGCAACSMECPTGTLETRETGDLRSFLYAHYRCICCGSCVAACPENAATLRHQVGPIYFLSFFKKMVIREKTLYQCEGCRDLFAPDRQIQKIQRQVESTGIELPQTLKYCSRCKKLFSHSKPMPIDTFAD